MKITQYALSHSFQGSGNLVLAYGGVYFGTSPAGWFNGHAVGDFGVVPLNGYQGSFMNGTGGAMLAAGPDGAVYASAMYKRSSDGAYFGAVERYDPYHHTSGVALTSPNNADATGRMTFDGSGRLWIFSQVESNGACCPPYVTIVTKPGTNVQQTASVSLGPDNPMALVKAPDGTIWGFGESTVPSSPGSFEYEAYHFSTDGAIAARFKIAQEFSPEGVDAVIGPDNAFWAIDSLNHKIYRVTTPGSVTSYNTLSPITLHQIAVGGDGALWVTQADSRGAKLDRITTAGQQTVYSLPPGCTPSAYGITGPGSSGLPWTVFVNCNGDLLEVTR